MVPNPNPDPQLPPHYTPGSMHFWDFVNAFSPAHQQPGMGTDHAPPPFQFPFQAGPHAGPHTGPHGPGPWWTPLGAQNPWTPGGGEGGRPRRHGRRHCGRRRCHGECDQSASSSPSSSDDEGGAAAAAGPSTEGNKDANTAGAEGEKDASPETGERGGGRRRHHHHRGPPSPDGGPHRHHHHHRRRQGPRPGFNGEAWIATLASHPLAQQLRNYIASTVAGPGGMGDTRGGATAAAAGGAAGQESGTQETAAAAVNAENNNDDVDTFSPPVDIFEVRGSGDPNTATASAWVVHVAVPGVKKEDVGVSWEAERGVLNISGVVYRPGDEEFQRGLVSSERRVGLFTRDVKLPPQNRREGAGTGAKEEIDGDGITARLEDGVLVVTVPSHEREWTEVRKVDIMKAIIDVDVRRGAACQLASGIIYGIPETPGQIPDHFYTDIKLKYFRAGGAQLLDVGRRGWQASDYAGRFANTLDNFRVARKCGGEFQVLHHDLWGADTATVQSNWPGDDDNWSDYEKFLDCLIGDIKANDMIPGVKVDVWNEPNLNCFWKRSRSDPELSPVPMIGPSTA
ncbi:hypothetical protein PspLS_07623 [Pyricularia sp. CBS 133598]|nr:hypothetical protein PspLS_07623 [Pyricularia sp. CBS 133598]